MKAQNAMPIDQRYTMAMGHCDLNLGRPIEWFTILGA